MRKIPVGKYKQESRSFGKSGTNSYGDNLHRLAFNKSLQANIIITASTGKIIAANSAACKLLSYSKHGILALSKTNIFNTEEDSFIKLTKQGITGGMSNTFVTGIKKSGKLFPCIINYGLFTDRDGKEKAVITLTDLSQSITKQKNIDAIKEKTVAHNIIIAKSKQKGIDIKNVKTVAHNITIAKSKQKKIDTKKRKIVLDNIHLAKSKQKGIDLIKNKKVADNIILAKSKQKTIDSKKEKIVADNIILAQAKSDDEKLAREVTSKAEFTESFKLIFNSTSDVLFDSDLITNKVTISDAYEKEFGYKVTGNVPHKEDWASHIHEDDLQSVMQDYRRMLLSEETEWKTRYRFVKADGSVVKVISNRIILRNADGKAYRMIGSMHDISKQKVLEEKLAADIKLREKQIADATEDAKETERSDIGRELHDNVNQLLGVSKMYLDMAKRGGENGQMYLVRSSHYTLTAIEEIRKLTKGLTTDTINNLGLCEAISNVIHDTMEVNPVKIHAELEQFKEQSVNDKFKLNVFRILQEQLNNILKHAKATRVAISLLQNKNSIILSIIDNGVGFDTHKKGPGIGIANIKNRATKYKGTADLVSQPGEGCVLTVKFPFNDAVRRTAVY